MSKYLIYYLLLGTPLFSQTTLDTMLKKHTTGRVPFISVDSLKASLNEVILLDTREQNEYQISHLKNAIHVGFNEFTITKTLTKLPKNKHTKIVVYCSLGLRSEKIGIQLMEAGYTHIANLYGGIFEWKNAHLTVVDSLENPTNNIHAFSKKWGKWLHTGTTIYE